MTVAAPCVHWDKIADAERPCLQSSLQILRSRKGVRHYLWLSVQQQAEGAIVRYEFPWPPKELSPNARVHWWTLAKAKRDYKEVCYYLALKQTHLTYTPHEQDRLIPPPVTAQVTFVCDARRRDADNHMAMLKPLWDALVSMGVLEDDSHDKLRILDPKWERGEKKVIVELSPYRDGGE